jgi:hypothetical protein
LRLPAGILDDTCVPAGDDRRELCAGDPAASLGQGPFHGDGTHASGDRSTGRIDSIATSGILPGFTLTSTGAERRATIFAPGRLQLPWHGPMGRIAETSFPIPGSHSMSVPPPLSSPAPAHDKDASDLRLLSNLYYAMSALSLLVSLIYLLMAGVSVFTGMQQNWSDPGMAFMAALMGFFGLFLLLKMVLEFVAARSLPQFRRRTFCMIVAALLCLNIPLGTALGVFTFIVLTRASVGERFEKAKQA